MFRYINACYKSVSMWSTANNIQTPLIKESVHPKIIIYSIYGHQSQLVTTYSMFKQYFNFWVNYPFKRDSCL